MIRKLYEKILFPHAKVVLSFLVLIFVLSLLSLPRLKLNNQHWLAKENVYEQQYQQMVDKFGADEALVVIIKEKDIFSENNLRSLVGLSEELAKIKHVCCVISPVSLKIYRSRQQGLEVKSAKQYLLEKGYSKNSIAKVREYIMHDSLSKNLFTKDFQGFTMFLNINSGQQDKQKIRKSIINKTQKILNTNESWRKDYQLIGIPYLSVLIDRMTISNFVRLTPLAVLLALLVLYFLYKSWRLALICLSAMGISIALAFGLMAINNVPVTIINLILPLMIIIIGLSDSIHIINRYQNYLFQSARKKESLLLTLEETIIPCFFTFFTSIVGFDSFITSELIPIRQFSIYCVLGLTISFLVTVIYVPLLLAKIDLPKNSEPLISFDKLWDFINGFIARKTLFLSLLGVLTCLSLVFSLRYLYSESNFIKVYFFKNHPVFKSYQYADQQLGGTTQYELVINDKAADFFKRKDTILRYKEIYPIVGELFKDATFYSYLDVLGDGFSALGRKFDGTTNQGSIDEMFFFLDMSGSDKEEPVLAPFMSFAADTARLRIRTPTQGSRVIVKLAKELEEKTKKIFPEEKVFVTGINLVHASLDAKVQDTLLDSLRNTFLPIAVILIVVFGLRMALIMLLPNVFPVAIFFGLMAALRFELNYVTLMVASVGFGLCLDDTIHYVYHFRELLKKGCPIEKAIFHCLKDVGTAMIFTSLLLISGFSILLFSDIKPINHFGLLSILIIFTAMIGDLIILPAVLKTKFATKLSEIKNK